MNDNKKTDIEKIIVYRGTKAYDITELIGHHPGGDKCLKNKNGQDVSEDYKMHTEKEREGWKKYLVKDNKNGNCIIS